METVKISATSIPKAVAGAIAARLENGTELEVRAVGAKAVNQAIKSLIVARVYCAKFNADLVIQPEFTPVDNASENIIGICMLVKRVPLNNKED